MTELRTPRLRLRPFTEADAPAHLALYQDPEVTRQLGGGPFLGDQIAARSQRAVVRFVRHWADKGFGVFAVEELATGRFLGQCGLNTIDELGEIEVLYALERAAWGRGLATEAARAALGHGFDDVRLPRIVAVTRPEHRESRRVMEKLGMRYEGDVDVFGIHAVLYALARDDFQAAAGPPAMSPGAEARRGRSDEGETGGRRPTRGTATGSTRPGLAGNSSEGTG